VKKTLIAVALAGATTVLAACGSSSAAPAAPATGAATGTPQTGNPTSAVTVNESGSTLLYPFLQEIPAPLKAKYSNVTLAPSGGGSGKGISDAANGITQVGGSDAYLTAAQLKSGLLNIPLAVSAQDVFYNLPGVTTSLKLNGAVLAQMYEGRITTWNDPAVKALNPGVDLPAIPVVAVHRSDGSGDTFIFSGFLAKTDPSTWGGGSGPGQGTTVTWPAAPGALAASGNPGMIKTCAASPGCVAYIGISGQADALAAKLGEAQLQDRNGEFVTANPTTIGNAVTNSVSNVPANLVADLLYAPGSMSYPIVNFEYAIVKPHQSDPATALAIRDFLTFTIDPQGGSTQALLSKENFLALPSAVTSKVDAAIASVQ
jgi:phosphate transport system substrate-binding protein